MITGDIKNQIDRIWDAFWSGGIANPLEVIEQITYLLFIRRLDDLHQLEENKAHRFNQRMERRIFPEGKDAKGRPYEDYRWSRFKHFAPAEMFTVIGEHLFPLPSRRSRAAARQRRLDLRPPHERCEVHHSDAGVVGKGGGPSRPRADGGARYKGRCL